MTSNNNIYFVVGDDGYQATTFRQLLAADSRVAHGSFQCFGMEERKAIHNYVKGLKFSKLEQQKYLLFTNLHLIEESNIRQLDFVFRLADHNTPIKNLNLVFIADSRTFEPLETYPTKISHWREMIAKRFQSTEKHFNGIAFSGRISSIYVDPRISSHSSFQVSETVCSATKLQFNQEYNSAGMDQVYTILGLFLIPLLLCHIAIYRRRLRTCI